MSDSQKPDSKAVIAAFNESLRDQRNHHHIRVTPSMSRDALNDALRIAAGRDPQHEGPEPEAPFPWRSLQSQDGA
jgi:hypothetical protein